jgi:hypothetical protein
MGLSRFVLSSDKSPNGQIGDISLRGHLKFCFQGFFDPKQFEGMLQNSADPGKKDRIPF